MNIPGRTLIGVGALMLTIGGAGGTLLAQHTRSNDGTPAAATAPPPTTPPASSTTTAAPTTTRPPATTTPPTTARAIVIRYTDPARVSQALQTAASTLIGRGVPGEDYKTFGDRYYQLEREAQTAEQQGRTSTPPDLAAQAAEFINTQHPDLVLGYRALHVSNLLRDALTGTTTTTR